MTDPVKTTPEIEELKERKEPLKPSQWTEIVAHYEYGTMRVKEIKEHYGITGAAISKHFDKCRRGGQMVGKFGCKAHLLRKTTEERVTEAAAGETAAEVVKAVTFASMRRARIEQQKTILYNASIANHVFLNAIQKDIKDGARTPANCANDLKALRHAEALVERRMANMYRLLEIDGDIDVEELPILEIADLTDERLEEIQQFHDDSDLDITDETEGLEDDDVIDVGVK